MYIWFILMDVIIVFMDLRPKKKLKCRNNIKIIDKLSSKLSKIQYKKDGKNYRELQQKIRNAGFHISPEIFQTIRLTLPLAVIVFYILFEVINYINLQVNIKDLTEAAKILNDETILNIHININGLVIILIVFVTLLIPDLIIKFMAEIRTISSKKESLILQTYTIMLLKTAKPVKQILISLYERADFFKPQLELALNKFSADPDKALAELQNSAPQNDFKNICIALLQAMNSDRKLSIMYLENHRNLAREVNKQIRIRNQTRKQGLGVLVMMVPLLLTIAIVGYPWLMYTIKAIGSIPV